MKSFIIVSSQAEDVLELKDNLRAEDIAECEAGGSTPAKSLLDGFTYSDKCYSVKKDGKTIAMFGVSSYNQPKGVGIIWFLGSDEVFKHPIALVKDSQKYIDKWFEEFQTLCNTIDKRNQKHIEWLKHLGFMFVEKPILINNYEFLIFYKRRQ